MSSFGSIELKSLYEVRKSFEKIASLEEEKEAIQKHAASLQKKIARKAPKKTGFLKRSVSVPEISDDGLSATVTVGAEYAGYVEYGTRYVEARPFIQPSLEKVTKALMKELGGGSNKETAGSTDS